MTCRFAHSDGSYVLGSLSPAERQEFEEHLTGCPTCARSVRELAGLPGLLARIDPDVLESPPAAEPVPETLLPSLVQQVRRTQRSRTYLTAAVAAAAAVAVTVGAMAAAGLLSVDRDAPTAQPPPSTVSPPVGRAMIPVGHAPVRASVAFESVAWGTRLDLTCTYAPHDGEYGWPAPAATYALIVHTRDGLTEQVATWRSLPDRTMRLAAATAASRADITSVEVRTTDGSRVLRLVA